MEKSAKETYQKFVAHMVHDLKSPAIVIGGYAHRLRSGKIGDLTDDQKHALDMIIENTKRLEHDLHMILDYFQSDREPASMMFPERVDVCALLKDQVENYLVESQEKGISLELRISPGPIFLLAYANPLAKAIQNLIDNALKYTPSGGRVIVSAESSEDSVVISIQDTGRGLRQKDIEDIVKPFEEVMDLPNRELRGFGLGLSNVKRYVDMHHGQLCVESAEGVGSTFTLIFPKRPVDGKELKK